MAGVFVWPASKIALSTEDEVELIREQEDAESAAMLEGIPVGGRRAKGPVGGSTRRPAVRLFSDRR